MAFELLNPMESFLRGRSQAGQEQTQAMQNATGQVNLLTHLQALKQHQQLQEAIATGNPALIAQVPGGMQHLKTLQDIELSKARVGNYGRMAQKEERQQGIADQQGAAVSALANAYTPSTYDRPGMTPVSRVLPAITPNTEQTPEDNAAIAAFKAQGGTEPGAAPLSMVAPNKEAMQGLAIQADPKSAIQAILKAQNPAGFAVGSTKVVSGGYLEKQPDGSTKFIETRSAPRTANPTGAAEPVAGDFTKKGPEFLSSLPETDRELVRKIANYDIDPKTLSTKGGHREKMLSLVSQFDPTYDDTQYANKRRAISQFGSGPQGNTVRNLNVAIEHIDTLQRAADALGNGNFTPGNKAYNETSKLFGKSPPTTFEGVRDIVANEVIKGTIGNAGALEDRKNAAEKVKAAASPKQLSELFNGWTELMGGQVSGLERQYEASTKNKDFRERYLTPRTRDAIALAESKKVGVPTSAVTGGNVPEFASVEEAASAGLKPGTRVKINGRTGTLK